MKKSLLLLSLALPLLLRAQPLYFPPTVGSAWDTLAPSSLGWCQPQIDSLYDYLEAENTKAFLLLKDGRMVLEKYFGTFTQDSIWYWASAGKTLTAFTVGIAQEEGWMDIGDTTRDYLGAGWTACPPLKEEKITLRHQLTMTSGLDDGVSDVYCTLDTCLHYLVDAGTRWAYHNGPYTLLDSVIESATGQTLNSYVTQKIKTPTGMTGLFIPVGYNHVFYSKARSMARFGLLLLAKGNWNGTSILADTAYFHAMTHPSQALNPSYGYLTWLNGQGTFLLPYLQFAFPGPINPSAPSDMYAAIGKNGQLINVVPSQNLVFVRMGNASDQSDVSITLNDTIWQFINRLPCLPTVNAPGLYATELEVYPNPAQDRIMVTCVWAGGGPLEAELKDMQGRVWRRSTLYVQDAAKQRFALELPSSLPGGMYFLEVEQDGHRATVKIVKR